MHRSPTRRMVLRSSGVFSLGWQCAVQSPTSIDDPWDSRDTAWISLNKSTEESMRMLTFFRVRSILGSQFRDVVVTEELGCVR